MSPEQIAGRPLHVDHRTLPTPSGPPDDQERALRKTNAATCKERNDVLSSNHRLRANHDRCRYAFEHLESRMLLAGDMNLGPYVLDGSDASAYPYEHRCEPGRDPVTTPAAENPTDKSDGSLIPETEDKWEPTRSDSPDPESDLISQFVQAGLPSQDQRDAGRPSEHSGGVESAAEVAPMISLPSTSSGFAKKHASSNETTSRRLNQTSFDHFHYFLGNDNSVERTQPLLSDVPLSRYVEHDPFTAMSLLRLDDPRGHDETVESTRGGTPSVVRSDSLFDRSQLPRDGLNERLQSI